MANESETNTINKIKIIDDERNTTLHYLCATGNLEMLKQEITGQTKMDVENYLGWTPLMMACRNGHLETVKFLLEKRADASKRNKYGMNVFLISIASGNLELVRLILQHLLCGGISKQSLQKVFSPISLAVLFSQADIVKFLIEHSFNINQQTPITGITPYMFSVGLDNCQISQIIIDGGADENIKNYAGVGADMIIAQKIKKAKLKEVAEHIPPKPQVLEPEKSEVLINPQPAVMPPPPPPQMIIHSPYQQIPNQNHVEHLNPVYMQYQPHYQEHKHNIPMIMINSPSQYGVMPPPAEMAYPYRKTSPHMGPLVTPSLTPIAPVGYMPQFFFPAEFNGAFVPSPTYSPYYGNEYLNRRFYPNELPSPNGCDMGYVSPCVM